MTRRQMFLLGAVMAVLFVGFALGTTEKAEAQTTVYTGYGYGYYAPGYYYGWSTYPGYYYGGYGPYWRSGVRFHGHFPVIGGISVNVR